MNIYDVFLIAICTCCGTLFSDVSARRQARPHVALLRKRCQGAEKQYYVDPNEPRCCPCSEYAFEGHKVVYSCNPPNQYIAYDWQCVGIDQLDEVFPLRTEPINGTVTSHIDRVAHSPPYVATPGQKSSSTAKATSLADTSTLTTLLKVIQQTSRESTHAMPASSTAPKVSPPEPSSANLYIILVIMAVVIVTVLVIFIICQMKRICKKKPNSITHFFKKVWCSKNSGDSEPSKLQKTSSHVLVEPERTHLMHQSSVVTVIEEAPQEVPLSSSINESCNPERSTEQFKENSFEEPNKHLSNLHSSSEPQEMCHVNGVRIPSVSPSSVPYPSSEPSNEQMLSPKNQACHIVNNHGSVHIGPVNIHQHYTSQTPTNTPAYIQFQHTSDTPQAPQRDFCARSSEPISPEIFNVSSSSYSELTNTPYKKVFPSQKNTKKSEIVTNLSPVTRQISKESYGRPVVSGPTEHDEDNTVTMTTDNSCRMSRQCSSMSGSSVDDHRWQYTRYRSITPEERDIRRCGDGGELPQTAKFQTAEYKYSNNSNNNIRADIQRRQGLPNGLGYYQTSRLDGIVRPAMQRGRVVQADVERQYSTQDANPTFHDSQNSYVLQRPPHGYRDGT